MRAILVVARFDKLVVLIVQKLGLQHFILYAHGPDLCHDLNIKHALANCFEAVMGTFLSIHFFVSHMIIFSAVNKMYLVGLQCFDAIGWMAGKASGL